MAKGQKRSNKDINKPKKKAASVHPATFEKGLTVSIGTTKAKP